MNSRLNWAPAWALAVASFVLAAATGALMRFSMYLGLPFGLVLGDVRHAHSHLMFFSWATPALMLMAALALRAAGRGLPGAAWLATVAALSGLASYVPFLLSGYGLLEVAGRELPLSMMTSGLNGLVWCAFSTAYLIGSWRRPRDLPLRLFDGAIVMLLVSTLGAALLAQAGISGTLTPMTMAAFVDLFLTSFADGWFGIGVLAALALVTRQVANGGIPARPLASGAAAWLLAGGAAAWLLAGSLAVRTLARLARDAYGVADLDWLIGVAGALAAAGWLWLVIVLWRQLALRESSPIARDRQSAWLAHLSLALLALKAVFELALATPAGERWVTVQGLHVPLLHAFLLGAVSLGLVAAARVHFSPRAFAPAGWLAAAALVMVSCLMPLTGLWPAAWSGLWTLRVAAYTSLGPPLIGSVALVCLMLPAGRLRRAGAD